jgi:hypothetical protein
MTFELKLSIPTTLAQTEPGQLQYDPELDDVGSVLNDICEALETAGVGFLARVCSDEDWPVTVSTDLLVVIEQIGDTLASLKQAQIGRLDFYEQGIEKTLTFTPKNGTVLIECNDLITKAMSKSEFVILPHELVLKELTCLSEDFLRVSKMCCPELANHSWFREWSTRLQHTLDGIRKTGPVVR